MYPPAEAPTKKFDPKSSEDRKSRATWTNNITRKDMHASDVYKRLNAQKALTGERVTMNELYKLTK